MILGTESFVRVYLRNLSLWKFQWCLSAFKLFSFPLKMTSLKILENFASLWLLTFVLICLECLKKAVQP